MKFLKNITPPSGDTLWTIIGGILTIGSFFVDNIMEERRIKEAVREELAEREEKK